MYKTILPATALLTVSVVLTGCQTTANRSTPGYVCRRADGLIEIDGELSETDWGNACLIDVCHVHQPRGTKQISRTVAHLLRDDEYLYLAFDCEDIDIWSYSDTPDDELWNGDVVEFFVKPARHKPLYYEFVIAPNGTLFDGRYPSRGAGGYKRFKPWTSGTRIATRIRGTDSDWTDTDQGYTVEAAIPMSAFAESGVPQPGATWTFSAFRYDYSKAYEAPLLLMVIPHAPDWGFHYYEGYLPLVFE